MLLKRKRDQVAPVAAELGMVMLKVLAPLTKETLLKIFSVLSKVPLPLKSIQALSKPGRLAVMPCAVTTIRVEKPAVGVEKPLPGAAVIVTPSSLSASTTRASASALTNEPKL